jgi:ABC-type nitrate/sulfonate/bicarbonate transport system permease component
MSTSTQQPQVEGPGANSEGQPPPSRPKKRWWQDIDTRTGTILLIIEVIVILILWQVLIGHYELIHPVFFPPPLETLDGFLTLVGTGELWGHAWRSITSWTIGYFLAVTAGTAIGLIVGSSIAADRLSGPFLWAIYATPWLAYRPLTVAWFGFGVAPIVFLVFIASIFPILLNTSAGIRTTDKSMLNAGRIFGASKRDLFTKIFLPSTLPFTLTGMTQGAIMATIALTVAELTGAAVGMGALIIFKANTYKTNESFAAIVLLVIWSIVIVQVIQAVSRRLAPWTIRDRD